jgi:hypothetical protein
MRTSLLFPAALVCGALVGQTAGPENLVQRFNTNLAGVNQLLNELKFQEAIDKAQSLVPAQAPVFVAKDPGTIEQSLESGRGMLALLKLQASCVGALGQWEKVVELNQSRLEYARTLRADLAKATGDLSTQWTKVSEEGNAYILQNEPKAAEIEKKIAALQQDIKNHNEKKVTLDRKQIEELSARAKQAPRDEEAMFEIKGKLVAFKEALGRYKQFSAWVAETHKQANGLLKESEEGLGKSRGSIKTQEEEISTFNADMLKKDKKFKAEGNKKWVEAVMRDSTNLTKLDTPRLQAQLLNRLLVLSPDDKSAKKALENIKQGRDPFFVEKPAVKSKKAPKK